MAPSLAPLEIIPLKVLFFRYIKYTTTDRTKDRTIGIIFLLTVHSHYCISLYYYYYYYYKSMRIITGQWVQFSADGRNLGLARAAAHLLYTNRARTAPITLGRCSQNGSTPDHLSKKLLLYSSMSTTSSRFLTIFLYFIIPTGCRRLLLSRLYY